MFLATDLLNEGKVVTNSAKRTRIGFSEGKNPKSYLIDARPAGCKPTNAQACVNSNWQKLRG